MHWSHFLIKLQAFCNIIKKRLQDSCFPVIFGKSLRAPILKNINCFCFLYFSRGVFRTLSNIYVGMSCKNNSWLLTFSYFWQQVIWLVYLSKNELSIPMWTVCRIRNKVDKPTMHNKYVLITLSIYFKSLS